MKTGNQTLDQAVERENNILLSIRRQRQVTLPEAFDPINEASRDIIKAMYEKYGQVYLGKVNSNQNDPTVLKQYDGGAIYNFSCDFCLPAYSKQVESLIMEWRTQKDVHVLERMFNAITEHGGHLIFWS